MRYIYLIVFLLVGCNSIKIDELCIKGINYLLIDGGGTRLGITVLLDKDGKPVSCDETVLK